MRRKHQGMTLIEVIMFIVIIGIISKGVLFAFNSAVGHSNAPGQIISAGQLSAARMEIITQSRLLDGLSGLTDPCASASPPDACAVLASYATSQGFTVNSDLSTASGVTTVTITVSGSQGATLVSRFRS